MASTRTSQTAGEAASLQGVTDSEASPDTEEDAGEVEVPKMTDIRGVRYIGPADRRILSVEALESLGIENPKGRLEFGPENNMFVPASDFNAATRDWLASQKTNFVIE